MDEIYRIIGALSLLRASEEMSEKIFRISEPETANTFSGSFICLIQICYPPMVEGLDRG